MAFFLFDLLFACDLVCVITMFQEDYHGIYYPNILVEIKKSTKDYMSMQFEHNNFFTEELKEHSILLDAITKQLDHVSKEVANLQS